MKVILKRTWTVIKVGKTRTSSSFLSLKIENIIIDDQVTAANEFNNYFLSISEEINKH